MSVIIPTTACQFLEDLFEAEAAHPPLLGSRTHVFLERHERSAFLAKGPSEAAARTQRESVPDSGWAPNTDIYESGEGLVVEVELAGIHREQLEITVVGQRLIFSGTRSKRDVGSQGSLLRSEINYGKFESVVEIPACYSVSNGKAFYQNGFLRVDIPKQPQKGALFIDLDQASTSMEPVHLSLNSSTISYPKRG